MNAMKNHGPNGSMAISPFDEIRKLFLNPKIVSKRHFATQNLCLITTNFGQLHTMVMSLSWNQLCELINVQNRICFYSGRGLWQRPGLSCDYASQTEHSSKQSVAPIEAHFQNTHIQYIHCELHNIYSIHTWMNIFLLHLREAT